MKIGELTEDSLPNLSSPTHTSLHPHTYRVGRERGRVERENRNINEGQIGNHLRDLSSLWDFLGEGELKHILVP